jgi:hypothetical protein
LASYDLGYFDLSLGFLGNASKHSEAVDIAAIGLIFSISTAVGIYEQSEMRRTNARILTGRHALLLLACVASFVICLGAILINWSGTLIFAITYGFGVLVAKAAIRRLEYGQWGYWGFVSLGILGVVGFIAASPEMQVLDPTLMFSSINQPSVAITQRILSDAAWFGTGAGTFSAVSPIYRDAGDVAASISAATAAASMAIGIGRAMLWATVIVTILGIHMLLQCALRRGRDSCYPAAGASCLLVLLILAFGNDGVLGPTISIYIGAILGLALSQSVSTTPR